ncbi:hypothetical protein M422DRAFT_241224 [Sphaerobolus stellatus SS14]|nr:hypothetical protein M422DRAFT_241224 [Sphaerobolus stellatus SS14]
MPNDTSAFQTLIDEAVAKGAAPGFQASVFNKDKVLFNGVAGYAVAPSDANPKGVPLTPSTILWMASCTKLVAHIVALQAIERGLIPEFTLDDLDNHEKLVQFVPEFKQGSGTLVTKILEGWEEQPGPDGKRAMRLRDAKNRMTLRMLLTHTSGLVGGEGWNNAEIVKLFEGSDATHQPHIFTGKISDLSMPLVFEPGTSFHYGSSTEWVALFTVRGTGKHLRALFKELVAEPLAIPSTEFDIWFPPSAQVNIAGVHVKNPTSPSGFSTIPLALYSKEDGPEEGHVYPAEVGLYSSLQAYVPILQTVLKQDERILKKETWAKAFKDDLKEREIKMNRPHIASAKFLAVTVEEYVKATSPEIPAGQNLLSCFVATTPTLSGRPAGSFGWGGIANTFFFVDPESGVGGIIGTQLLPFMEPGVIEIRDKFESLVYEVFVKKL